MLAGPIAAGGLVMALRATLTATCLLMSQVAQLSPVQNLVTARSSFAPRSDPSSGSLYRSRGEGSASATS
eukprot:7002159-Pyramimonas_sp.AAC.1